MPAVTESNSQTLPISEQTCLLWVNSFKRNENLVNWFEEEISATVFAKLIKELTGVDVLSQENVAKSSQDLSEEERYTKILEHMKNEDVTAILDAKELARGNVTETIKALWLICLHFDIHSQKRASYQRTVRLGKRFMLDWISDEINDYAFQNNDDFVKCFSDGYALQKLVSKYHKDYEVNAELQSKEILHTVLDVANSNWDIPKTLLSPDSLVNETVSEIDLLVYLAIMRRKILQDNKSLSPAKGPTRETSPSQRQLKMESPKQRMIFRTDEQASNVAGILPKDDSPLKDRAFDIKDFLSKLSPRRSTDTQISSSNQDISTKQQTKTFSDPKVNESGKNSENVGDEDKAKWKTAIRDFNRNWELEFENNDRHDDVNLFNEDESWRSLNSGLENELNKSLNTELENESRDMVNEVTDDKDSYVSENKSEVDSYKNQSNQNNMFETEESVQYLRDTKATNVPILIVQSPTPSCSDASDLESDNDEVNDPEEGRECEDDAEEKYAAEHGDFYEGQERGIYYKESGADDIGRKSMHEGFEMEGGDEGKDEEEDVQKSKGLSKKSKDNDGGVLLVEEEEGELNNFEFSAQHGIVPDNQHTISHVKEDTDSLTQDRESAASNTESETVHSTDQAETSLLTSWSEHQLGQEITRDKQADNFIKFESTEHSSPVITWGSTKVYESSGHIDNYDGDADEDILQTSTASATELRMLLEESLRESPDFSEGDVENGPSDQKRGNGVCNSMGIKEDNSYMYPNNSAIVFSNNELDRYNLFDKLDNVLDELYCLALLKSSDDEKGRLEAVQGIRLEMEECCDGIPIEKVSSVVFDRWIQIIDSIVENKDTKCRDSEKRREELLREMRDELNVLAKENLNLSKISTDANSFKMQNELLNKQINGLENYVESLEGRIEVQSKENADLLRRTEAFQDELSTKQQTIDRNRNNYEGQVTHLRDALADANETKTKLQSEIKIKDIELKKLQNEIQGIRDETRTDFERIQIDAMNLRTKVTELQQQNEALRTANEADQTIIKHLEAKLKDSEKSIEELKSRKREVLVDLQESREREKNLMKDVSVLEKDKSDLEKNNDELINEIKNLKAERIVLERELSSKISIETKSTEAMLGELKKLEKSLNEVRREKSLVEDKYNNVKCENERLHKSLKVAQLQKKTKSAISSLDLKNDGLESLSGTTSPYDSEVESIDSYAGFPDVSFQSPSVAKSQKMTPKVNGSAFLNTPDHGGMSGNQSYSVEDTRSWLRNMETKLQQTNKVLRSVKRSPHVKI